MEDSRGATASASNRPAVSGSGKRQTTWISSRVHSSIPARASSPRACAARQKAAQLPQVLWSVRATISSPARAHMAARSAGVISSLPHGDRQE